MSRSNRNAAVPDKPRYLKIRRWTNRRGEAFATYWWIPRVEDAKAYGLPRQVRLAAKHATRCGDGSAYFEAALEAELWNAKLERKRAGSLGDAATIPGTVPYFIAQFKTTPKYGRYSKATKIGT